MNIRRREIRMEDLFIIYVIKRPGKDPCTSIIGQRIRRRRDMGNGLLQQAYVNKSERCKSKMYRRRHDENSRYGNCRPLEGTSVEDGPGGTFVHSARIELSN